MLGYTSTETTQVKVISDIINAAEEKHVILLGLLDMTLSSLPEILVFCYKLSWQWMWTSIAKCSC